MSSSRVFQMVMFVTVLAAVTPPAHCNPSKCKATQQTGMDKFEEISKACDNPNEFLCMTVVLSKDVKYMGMTFPKGTYGRGCYPKKGIEAKCYTKDELDLPGADQEYKEAITKVCYCSTDDCIYTGSGSSVVPQVYVILPVIILSCLVFGPAQ